ncbi:MAG: phosphoribosylglycinamide formyltransferase [Candidatus Eisenbacteria bacterium]
MTSPRTRRLAVLASGRGSNFRALAAAAARDALGGTIAVLACDRGDAGAVELARERSIAVELPDPGPSPRRVADSAAADWIERLRAHDVDTLLLAGFMRILPPMILDAFAGRVLNIHPSLLPAFPGLDAIARAWEHGVRQAGCTVHLVTAGIDDGPILGQAAVEVRDEDTLETLTERVHDAEHALYPAVVRRYLATPFRIEGRRVAWGGAGERA